jgi:uncharacterized protein (DUF2336 family)
MVAIKEQIPQMLDLAQDRSAAAREQLATMLADIFLAKNTYLSLREEEMVNELIDLLMVDSTPNIQAALREKFTDVTRIPRRIAFGLARDSIDVARDILVANLSLADEDLIQIVEETAADHALAIAARAKISEAVADALVTTGDVRVMRAVAENLGAHLSRRAVNVVVDAARYSSELRKPVLYRPEMSADAAIKLYWWVEQDLRRYALKRFGIGTGQVDQALATTIASLLDSHVQQKANDEVMAQVVQWMHEHQAISPQVLPQVLRMGHFRLFNMLLAHMAHLSLSLVDTITTEAGGRGLASICRAIGIDKPGFVSLFLLSRGGRPGDQVVHPRELSNALATFDRMSPGIAKDLLHSWSVNPDYFTKHGQESSEEEAIYGQAVAF